MLLPIADVFSGAGGDLVGRRDQLRQLVDLVSGGRHRVVTVTGPGGVGKSRLVAELVTALRRQSAIEVRTLDLSALAEPGLVGESIAEALGGRGFRLSPVERIVAQLGNGRLILVLDCFERVVAAAPFVSDLVRRCPGVRVVVTSQRPLRINGERQFRLDPLPLPAAVELFARRAAAATPGFVLGPTNAEAVGVICRAVDGLPLAVELAAARMRVLTPAELAARLDRQLQLLADGAADLPARQRSLRATIEFSLGVVAPDARILFAWLGAFAGGVLGADLAPIADRLDRDEAWLRAALGELVETSLVRVAPEAGGSRYSLLDAMAELARQRLDAAPERAQLQDAVAQRYLAQVRRWSREPSGPMQAVAEGDAANVRSAVQHALRPGADALDPGTAEALYLYYEFTGRLREGQEVLAAAAAAGQSLGWILAGQFARMRGDLDEAARLGALAVDALDPADHAMQARARLHLGGTAAEARDARYARAQMRAALASANRSKDHRLIGTALNQLGILSAEIGRLDHAQKLFAAALSAKRRSGASTLELERSLHNLAEIALEIGQYESAIEYAREALALIPDRFGAKLATVRALAFMRLGRLDAARAETQRAIDSRADPSQDPRRAALIDLRCSVVLHAAGEYAAAVRTLLDAMPVVMDNTQRYYAEGASALESHAALLVPRDTRTAAHLLGAAARLRHRADRLVPPVTVAQIDSAVAACRTALGADRFDAAYRHGFALERAAALIEVCRRIAP
jgi:predicted ATPase